MHYVSLFSIQWIYILELVLKVSQDIGNELLDNNIQ